MRALFLWIVLIAGARGAVSLRDGCGDDAGVVASIEESGRIKILHAVAGEATPCYAVLLNQDGTDLRGYIQGAALPVIQEFERKRALAPAIAPAPSGASASPMEQAPTAAPELPSSGPPFEAWRGMDTVGHPMAISPGTAKATLVVFWAGGSKPAERLAKNMMKTEAEFGRKSLKAFGFIEVPDLARAGYYLDDMGLDYPQALGRPNLATKYHANSTKGTTLVIDASSRIVASSSDPAEIRAAVAKLLSPNRAVPITER